MNKKNINFLSLIIVAVFLMQASSFIQSEVTSDDAKISITIDSLVENTIRKMVLHFDTQEDYNNYLETNQVKLEFPNLKMVLIEGKFEKESILEQYPSVSSVHDITNSRMYRIEPPEITEYTMSSQDVKKTVTTKDLLNVQPLWDLGYKGDNIIFYDVDTGLNTFHLDFQGRIMNESKSFVNTLYGWNVNDSSILDADGHGTHTTGIGAGAGIANPLYIGMAPEAEILIGRISQGGSAPLEPFLAAYDYGISLGVDVISLSWGGGDTEGMDLHELAAEETIQNGIVFVTSAGNEGGAGFHTVGRPGTSPNSICVAGTTDTGRLYGASSKGPSADGYAKPDVAAPGQDITSCGIANYDAYVTYSGTSMACPHIAGITTVLIQALQDLGIPYDPHMIKAALMAASDPGIYTNLVYGAGIPDLELALDLIQTAPTNGSGFPALLWVIPSFPPKQINLLPQGFHADMFLQSVSSTPYNDLPPILTGNISSLVTLNTTAWTGPGSKNYYISFNIPDDALLGFYDGYVTFETAGGVSASTYISTTVIEGTGKILYTKLFSGMNENNLLGTYKNPIVDLLSQGIAVNEYKRWNITGEVNIISDELLQDYQTVWIADPWDYDYVDWHDVDTRFTYHVSPYYYDEITRIQNFVTNGGSLLVNVEGSHIETYSGYPPLLIGYNTTLVNELLLPFEISIDNNPFEVSYPERAQVTKPHLIADGVSYIDHVGTYLTTSGNSEVIVKHDGKGICAVREEANGGRVVVVTNNVFMDTIGYKDQYSLNTQNQIFTKNMFKWLASKEKIIGNFVEDLTGADFSIHSLNPAAVLSASLSIGTSTDPISLVDDGGGMYSYRLDFTIEEIYTFRVTSSDDKYIGVILYDSSTPTVDTGEWTNNTVPGTARLDFEVSDATTDIVAITVSINGHSVSTTGSGKIRNFVLFTSSLEEGNNLLEIYARDFAGNVLDISYIIPTVEVTSSQTTPESTGEGFDSTMILLISAFGIASLLVFRRRK